MSKYGGAGQVTWANDMGILPTRNFQDTHFDKIADLDGKHLGPNITRSRGCRRCPIRCKAELKFQAGKHAETPLARPEFESMLTFGPRCGVTDLETVVYLDNVCSRMGLDSISTGGVIAFAMDLWEHGILTAADTDGLALQWGDGKVMETLIRQIAYQEGFGKILAQGVRRAAQIIGRGTDRFAAHVKGLELSTYNPFEIMGTALGYAVASRGGDFSHVHPSLEYRWSPEKAEQFFHTPSAVDIHSTKGKGKLVKWAMCVNAVVDSLGICKVPALALLEDFDLTREAELLSIFLEEDISTDKLATIGERIATFERLFNLRHGATCADDTLPPMFTEDAEHPVPIKAMVQDFYAAMGWDERGIPSHKKLAALSVEPN
jgi:aldehyde:ferredoxin oxidoreductase